MWATHRNRSRLPALWVTALLAFFLAADANAQEPASVVLVFDGSGSMAGNIEGVRGSKIALARDATRRALAKLAPQTRLGLVAFGHRRGDCSDAEVLRPLEPLDAQRVGDSLERMVPRGRGPVTTALREAARAFPTQTGKRSLVLIHDDADNCQQNVCVAADELRRAGIVVHIVGLGLKPADAASMACLPQATGGRLVNARTAEQIVAGMEEVLRLADSEAPNIVDQPGMPGVPRLGPQAGALPQGAPAIPTDGAPGLYLRALLMAGAEPLNTALHWTVVAEARPETVLYAGRAANPYVAAGPGRYIVEARDGATTSTQTFDVGDKGPTAVNLVLNAGTLLIKAQAQKSGAILGDAIVTVREASQAADAAGPPVAMFKGGEGQLTLPAGRYLVRVEQGLVRAERAVVVAAGSQGRVEVSLNAARLLLSIAGQDAAASAETTVLSVVEDDPDAPKGRREMARSAARQADFVVPPGTYYVIARQGGVETRERIAVGPGDTLRRALNLSVGRLALAAKPPGGAARSEPISYRVERLDGPGQEVVTTSRRYRVESRYGAMNARAVRDVDIKAGQTQQLTLEPQAATLRLRLVSAGAASLSDVLWDIRDESGATVWTTGQAEPHATLQAGRYAVRAETREKRYDRVVELRAGESRLVEFTAD
jgi:Ca-activated chloride channel homolog